MSKKRLFLIIASSLLGALVLTAWILDKSGVFVRALKPQVISALSQATGRKVKVASIEGGVFGAIVLRDLSLGYGDAPAAFDAAVEVKKATVRFSLWDFFILKKAAIESLRSLELDGPDIAMRILSPSAPSADLSPKKIDLKQLLANLPLPPISTSVSDGRVTLSLSSQGQGELVFEGLDAELSADHKSSLAKLSLGGRAYGGRLGIKARFKPADASAVATLELKGLDLARLSNSVWVPEAVPALSEGRADGKFSLEIGKSFNAKGSLRVSGVAMKISNSAEVRELQAELRLDGRRLDLEGLRFKSQGATWQGRGEVLDFEAPELKMRVGSVEGRPAWNDFSVEKAALTLRASRQSVALEGLTLSSGTGSISASGAATFSGAGAAALDFSVHAQQFPLSLLSANINGELRLSGSADAPAVTAALNSDIASYQGETFEKLGLNLASKGREGVMDLQGDWRGFKNLKLGVKGRPEQFTLKLDHELDSWLKGEASLRGTGKDAELIAKIDGKTLACKNGQAFPIEAEIRVKGGVFRLESFKARGGEISATGSGEAYDLRLSKASLAAIAALSAQSENKVSGFVGGGLSLRKKGDTWTAAGKLSATELSAWGLKASSLKLDGEIAPKHWKLARLEATQEGGGSLSGSAEFDPGDQGIAAFRLSSKRWKLGGRDFSFDAVADGDRPGAMARIFKRVAGSDAVGGREIGGDLKFSSFAADSKDLPDLSGTWSWFDRHELKLKGVSWGNGVSLQGGWDEKDGWKLALSAKNADWRPVAILAGLEKDAVKSPLNAELNAQGKGASGDLRLSLGSGLQAHLAWTPDGSGKTRLNGGADFSDFEVSKALELASLWAGPDFRESTKDFGGKLNAGVSIDGGNPLSLSFSAKVAKLKQGSDTWGPLSLQGQLKDGALLLQKVEAGDARSNLVLENLSLKKDGDGRMGLAASFTAEGFPDFAFMKMGGSGDISLHSGKGGGSAEVTWARLRLNRQDFEKGGARLAWTASRIEASELAEPSRWKALLTKEKEGGWKIESIHANLPKNGALDAKDTLDEEGNQRLETSGTAVEASLIARMLDWKIDLGGLVYGNGVFRMPKDKDGCLYMLLSAKVENGNLEGFPFDLASGTVRLEDGTLFIEEKAHVLRRDRYEAEVTGNVPIYRNDGKALAEMNLKATILNANLGLIDYLDAIDSASGTVTAEVSITGKAMYPDYNGKAEISGGVIKFKRLLAPATDLQGQLFLEKNRLDIIKLDAQMGATGQRLYVEKGPAETPAILFDQWILSKMNIRLRSGKVGIRAEGNPNYSFMTGTLIPDLVLDGSWDDPTFKGTLALKEATVIWPPLRRGPTDPDDPKSFSNRLNWDLYGQIGENVIFRSFQDVKITEAETVRATITTDQNKGIRLRGAGDSLRLSGRIKPIRGRISFLSADFNLDPDKNGMVEFRQEQPPYLDIWGYRDVGSTRVDLHATGELGKIDVKLSRNGEFGQKNDDQAAEQAELASLVGLGTSDPSKMGGKALGKSFTWLVRSFIGATGKEIGKKFGMDTPIDFTVQGSVLDRLASTSTTAASGVTNSADNIEVNIGKQIFPKVYVKAGIGTKDDTKGGSETYGNTGVEVDVGKGQKIELIGGVNDESRAQYRAQQNFDNYDPRKRKEEMRRKREKAQMTPTATPNPVPALEKP